MSKKKQRQQRLEDLPVLFKESGLAKEADSTPTYASDTFKHGGGVVSSAALADFKLPSQESIQTWCLDKASAVCHYARFHQPVPPYVNKEPVSEFKVKSDADKYKVDTIVYTPHGVIWTANGETNIVPLANVIYVRTVV